MSKPSDYFQCSHCGAKVKRGSAACPECGSDENTGWSQEAEEVIDPCLPTGYGNEDSFESDFNYSDFIRREFGIKDNPASNKNSKKLRKQQIITSLVIILLILVYVFRKLSF